MYGEAPFTVSVSIVTVTDPPGSAGKSFLTAGKIYANVVGLETDCTTVEIL